MGQRRRNFRNHRITRVIAPIAALSLIGGSLLVWEAASATTPTPVAYNFQLDGDISASSYGNFGATPPAAPTFDWNNFFAGCGGGGPACQAGEVTNDIAPTALTPDQTSAGYVDSAGRADYALPDSTVFTTGSKDTLPVSGWTCTQKNNIGAKDDLLNAYQVAWLDPTSGDTMVFFGAEKSSNLGDNNIAIWLLQDKTVDCSSSGGAVPFTGAHQNGDILLAAAFSNGGSTVNIQVFTWGGCGGNNNSGTVCTTASPGALGVPVTSNQKCLASTGAGTPTLPPASGGVPVCAIANEGSVNPPWTSTTQAKTTLNGGLAPEEFYEGGIDITALLKFEGSSTTPCFASTITDTRSSTSPTATIFDFVRSGLSTCGNLTVNKYIDVNDNGTNDTGDVIAGMGVTGWAFAVFAGASPPVGAVPVCSGTTDANGNIKCPSLPAGTYTVTETQQSGDFNTQAGSTSAFNTGATVSTVITMGTTDQTTTFGNDCYINKTFEVDGVPTGAAAPSGLTVHWSIEGVAPEHGGSATSGTVMLHPETGTPDKWSNSLPNVFTYNDTIDWYFYVTGDPTHTVTGATGEVLSAQTGAKYPTCAVTNTVQFPPSVITGFKYKDINNNGTFDGTDQGINGFQFELLSGTTPVQVVASATDAHSNVGIITFNGVDPGAYTVKEVHGCTALPAATNCVAGPPTGWTETEPIGNSVSITVNLGDGTDALSSNFGDTPLSHINTTFTPDATLPVGGGPATQGTWSCTNSSTVTVGSGSGGTYSATGLPIGKYTCTVTITDP